ncbi:MAG: hypothetical protein K6E32_09330 [Lachnospiraceae bacterium]|nr:hypothetical protein [Lachnospiraceae bacterium]
MNVNGVTSSQAANAYSAYTSQTKAKEVAKDANTNEEAAAVYEPSNNTAETTTAKTYTPNTEMIDKLKADAEARTQSLRTLVEKLMGQQATKFGEATDIWSFLKSGEYEVDPETKAQAQKDIAEDGYWGVEKTSDRIVQFAMALTGGDPDKLDSMIDAFKEGYRQAEETWGGELPEISKNTYDAVLDKFEKIRSGEIDPQSLLKQ